MATRSTVSSGPDCLTLSRGRRYPDRSGAAMPHTPDAELKAHLDLLYGRYGATFLDTDPICFPRRYAASEDQEVIAFLATAIAYGRVPQIQASMQRLAAVMGPGPARFVRGFDPAKGRRQLR